MCKLLTDTSLLWSNLEWTNVLNMKENAFVRIAVVNALFRQKKYKEKALIFLFIKLLKMNSPLLHLLLSSLVINFATSSVLKEEQINSEPSLGCVFNNETFVPVGETIPGDGCAELKCTKNEDDHLVLVHCFCPDPVSELPANCRRMPRPSTNYPDCCVDVVGCNVVVAVPTQIVYDGSNITLMDADAKQQLLKKLNILDDTSALMSNDIDDEEVEGFPQKSLQDENVRKFVREHLNKKGARPE